MSIDLDLNQVPPNDIAAERAVLGACMQRPDIIPNLTLTANDFYRPAHDVIWQAMKSLHTLGIPADWVAVNRRLAEEGQSDKTGGVAYIHGLASELLVGEIGYYADIVQTLAARRRLIDAHLTGLQRAYKSPDTLEDLVHDAEAQLRAVPVSEPDHTGTLMSLDEFCDQEVPDADWVIPGLLSRGDRLMLTGSEGLGKTVLMRQFAVCAAAGIHPFTLRPIPAMTALYVDAENPKSIMVKSFSDLRGAVRRNRGPIPPNRLWIERVPAGLNLGDAADKLWLQRLVTLVNPDLLCLGPAYKLYRGSAKDREEDLARQVTSALDSIRESVGCALILEHHAGHGESGRSRDMRPFGSSLWLRWPEFGFGIRAAEGSTKQNRLVDFLPWRGARDERDWPEQLAAGTNFMPWVDGAHS